MTIEERRDAESALYALLDDHSPLARRALAESFAGSADAPPAVIQGLARDVSDISALVLTRSPLLTDSDLIDCAVVGDATTQAAIALRGDLTPAVCGSLAELAGREAVITLAVNEAANIPDFALRRMVERFGEDAEVREALLERAWLPSTVRAALAEVTARALTEYAVSRNWLSAPRGERIARDGRDRATMIIAAQLRRIFRRDRGACGLSARERPAHPRRRPARADVRPEGPVRGEPRRTRGPERASRRRPHTRALVRRFRGGLRAGGLSRRPAARVSLRARGAGADVHDEAQSGALRLSLVQAVLADCVGDGGVRAGQSDRAAAPVRTRRRPRRGPARCGAHTGRKPRRRW